MNYYELLGVNKSSTNDEIKKAYRKLAMKYHPDRNAGDKKSEEKFKEINEAYAVLSDINKKRDYDYRQNLNTRNINPNSGYRNPTQKPFGERASSARSYHHYSKGDFDSFFDDEIGEILRRARQQRRQENPSQNNYKSPPVKKRNQKVFKLNFWESIFGAKREHVFTYQKKKFKNYFDVPKGVDERSLFLMNIEKYNIKKEIAFSINKDRYFTRNGLDLYVNLILPKKTKSIILKHWKSSYEISISDKIKDGMFLSLNGLGVEKNNEVGKLYIKIHFLPDNYTKLSTQQKSLYKAKGHTIAALNGHIKRNKDKYFIG